MSDEVERKMEQEQEDLEKAAKDGQAVVGSIMTQEVKDGSKVAQLTVQQKIALDKEKEANKWSESGYSDKQVEETKEVVDELEEEAQELIDDEIAEENTELDNNEAAADNLDQ